MRTFENPETQLSGTPRPYMKLLGVSPRSWIPNILARVTRLTNRRITCRPWGAPWSTRHDGAESDSAPAEPREVAHMGCSTEQRATDARHHNAERQETRGLHRHLLRPA